MAIEEVYLNPADYDLELSSKEVNDLAFWQQVLRDERPCMVLEVGCGTGRLTLPLARQGVEQGFQITGLEAEEPMLERARIRRAEESAQVRRAVHLLHGDIRTMSFPALFDVILLPYGVAHHLTSLDEQVEAWQTARRYLRPGGLLIVDVGAPEAQVLAEACQGTKRHVDLEASDEEGHRLRRTVASSYAPAEQLATHAYVYHATDPDGRRRRYPSDFQMHIFYPREMELLCRLTGFTVEKMLGSYQGEPFEDSSPLMITFARAL